MDQEALALENTSKRAVNSGALIARIYTYLLSIGVIASCTVFGILWWLTVKIDNAENHATKDKVNLFLDDRMEATQITTMDYGHWTAAWELVSEGDSEGVYANLGSSVTNEFILNRIYILDHDQNLLYAYDPEGECGAGCYDPEIYTPLLSELASSDPYEYEAFSSPVGHDDFTAHASVVWITPDNLTDELAESLPILIGVHTFTANSIKPLEQDLEDVTIHNAEPSGTIDFVELNGMTGAVGWLSWIPKRPGTVIRNESFGWVAIICAVIIVCAIFASRHFGRLARQLSLMSELASTDPLTGLLNRAGLEALKKTHSVKKALQTGEISVLVVDVNKFKELNDSHGHLAGDAGLKEIARQFSRFVRRSDWVVRLGGDEFVAIFTGPGANEAAHHVGKRLLSESENPISYGDVQFLLRSSVGIASGEPGIALSTLIERADAAMYCAKRNHSDRPVKYDSSMKIGAVRS